MFLIILLIVSPCLVDKGADITLWKHSITSTVCKYIMVFRVKVQER